MRHSLEADAGVRNAVTARLALVGITVSVLVLLLHFVGGTGALTERPTASHSDLDGDPALVAVDDSAAEESGSSGSGSADEDLGLADRPLGDLQASAAALCDQRLERYAEVDDPFDARVLASYAAEAGDAAAEHESRRGSGFRSPLRDERPDAFVAACFFEADAFGLAYAPRHGESLPDSVHTRLFEVVLPDGEILLLAAGRADDVQPAPLAKENGR